MKRSGDQISGQNFKFRGLGWGVGAVLKVLFQFRGLKLRSEGYGHCEFTKRRLI